MTESRSEHPDWLSFSQLVQDLIDGVVRRHTFTQCELELLLDLQMMSMRKSTRSDLLRRYLRAIQQLGPDSTRQPPRLAFFLAQQGRHRPLVAGSATRTDGAGVTASAGVETDALAGLSSS